MEGFFHIKTFFMSLEFVIFFKKIEKDSLTGVIFWMLEFFGFLI